MPWTAIQYVTSGLTLAAFVAVVVLQIYRQRLKTWEKTLELAEPGERTNLALGALESFHVDTNRLTKDQAYRIAMETIRQRARRHLQYAILMGLFGALTFSYLVVSVSRVSSTGASNPKTPVSPEPVNLPKQDDAPAKKKVELPRLEVIASPVNIDFSGRSSGGPRHGCACGGRDIAFPNSPYNVTVDEEFTFRYEDSPICVGQGFDNFSGTISWGGGQVTQMANNNRNDIFPGIAGTLKVRYSQPGDYNVVARFTLDCLDVPACRNTCSASGTTEVHVR